jgi:hypothetical protein
MSISKTTMKAVEIAYSAYFSRSASLTCGFLIGKTPFASPVGSFNSINALSI